MSLFLSSRCLVVFSFLLAWLPWWIRLQCCQSQDGKSNSFQNSQLSKPEASFNPIVRQQRLGDWGGPGGPPFGRLVLIMQRLAFPQTCLGPSGFSLRSSPSALNNNCFLVVSTIKTYLSSLRYGKFVFPLLASVKKPWKVTIYNINGALLILNR